jgi:mono/diheme cytochrome c family protein
MAATKRTSSTVGDLDRGKALFEGKGTCTSCHRVNGVGARLGPDLSNVGQLRRAVNPDLRGRSRRTFSPRTARIAWSRKRARR